MFFSISSVIIEFVNDFKSFKLISYRYNADSKFIKNKFLIIDRIPGFNSEGSQGSFNYLGIIESTGKKESISGWIKPMESKWHFDEKSQQYYFNIWYCPNLDVIMEIIEGDINDPKNKSFNGWMIQSWFRAIMFIMAVPFSIIVYKIKKSNK